jgi:hypothetical protein
MKTLLAMVVGAVSLLATGIASAQNGNMMNGGAGGGWMGGYSGMDGYGGIWVPTFIVVLVAVLMALLVKRK